MSDKNKGIWIPLEVWECEELTLIEKHFLCEIKSLDNSNGCFASNAKFAKFFNISAARCTQIIKSLEAKGFIKIHLEREGKQIVKRVVNILNRGSKLFKEGSKKTKEPSKYSKEGVVNFLKESNTIKSNTISNTIEDIFKDKKEVKKLEDVKRLKEFYLDLNDGEYKYLHNYFDVLIHFMEKTNKEQRVKLKAHHIIGQDRYKNLVKRFKEGYTVENCKAIINFKCHKWLNDEKMNDSLNMTTLFRPTHIERYLDESDNWKGKNKINGTYTPPYSIPPNLDKQRRYFYFMARYEAYKPYLREYLINTKYRQKALIEQNAEGLCYELEQQNPDLAKIQITFRA